MATKDTDVTGGKKESPKCKCKFFNDVQRKEHAERPDPHYNVNVRFHLRNCDGCKEYFTEVRKEKGLAPLDYITGRVEEKSRA